MGRTAGTTTIQLRSNKPGRISEITLTRVHLCPEKDKAKVKEKVRAKVKEKAKRKENGIKMMGMSRTVRNGAPSIVVQPGPVAAGEGAGRVRDEEKEREGDGAGAAM